MALPLPPRPQNSPAPASTVPPAPKPVMPPVPAPAKPAAAGWAAAQAMMDAGSGFVRSLKPTTGETYIKFLEDGPYATYSRHWILGPSGKKRPYTCLGSNGGACPICGVGDKPQMVSAFNVIEINQDGTFVHRTWGVGSILFKVIVDWSKDPKTSPITKHYFIVKVQGTATQAFPAHPSIMLSQEGFLRLPEESEYADLPLQTTDDLEYESVDTLKEIAATLVRSDDH